MIHYCLRHIRDGGRSTEGNSGVLVLGDLVWLRRYLWPVENNLQITIEESIIHRSLTMISRAYLTNA